MKRIYLKHLAFCLISAIILSVIGFYSLEYSIKASIFWGVSTSLISHWAIYKADKKRQQSS